MNRINATPASFHSIGRGRRAQSSLRARIAAAFRKLARGVDERTAYAQTRDFYRSSGSAWARFLSRK